MRSKIIIISTVLLLVLIGCASAGAVKVAPYIANVSTATDALFYSPAQGLDAIASGHADRIAQTGNITMIKVKLENIDRLTTLTIRTWAKNDTNGLLSVRSESTNLRSSVQNGVNNITLDTPIEAQEGDFWGIHIAGVDGAPILYCTDSIDVNLSCSRYAINMPISNVNLSTLNPLSVTPGVELYMNNISMIFIGDSLISGTWNNAAFTAQPSAPFIYGFPVAPWTSIPYKFSALSGLSYQNMGIHGDAYPNLYKRFKIDVIDKSPKYVLIEGGENNFAKGDNASTVFSYQKQQIIDAQNAGIKTIVLLDPPYYYEATKALNQMIIDYHAQNPNFTIVDAISDLGVDSGSSYTLKPQYASGDNVHLTEDGNAVIAQDIYNQYILNDNKTITMSSKAMNTDVLKIGSWSIANVYTLALLVALVLGTALLLRHVR